MITAQAVVSGCVRYSWSQVSTFQCRMVSLWAILLCGYRDMDQIDIGIKMQYRYRYRYKKTCNDMQPYDNFLPTWLPLPQTDPPSLPVTIINTNSLQWIHTIHTSTDRPSTNFTQNPTTHIWKPGDCTLTCVAARNIDVVNVLKSQPFKCQ